MKLMYDYSPFTVARRRAERKTLAWKFWRYPVVLAVWIAILYSIYRLWIAY